MGVKLIVAVTDSAWFDHLRALPDLDEVNFWSPSPKSFVALQPGELFLFKLRSPRNYIVGGGVFAYANVLPLSLAWNAFGQANGARTLKEMRESISQYRKADAAARHDFCIGCRILTQPFFLDERAWLSVPETWAPNIVSFKRFDTEDADGRALWEAVLGAQRTAAVSLVDDVGSRFGQPQLILPRLGQGAFRVVVTDSYQRRCAITGERTLPALEAAHILPYAQGGGHQASNGILFRRDIHSLFDAGYVTVTPDMHFEVSRRIKEEFENGRHYYSLHGQTIGLPERSDWRPDVAKLTWHNEETYLG